MTGERPTVAEMLVAVLHRYGVRRMFGIPGGGSSLDVIEAGARGGIDFVLTRTEAAASIMAAVTAELSGAPGAVVTALGPGAASAVNGLAYARLDRAAVALIADAYEPDQHTHVTHQALDQAALYRPVAKAYCRLGRGDGPARMAALLDAALADPRGPVHVDLSGRQASSPAADNPPPAAAPAEPGFPAAAVAAARRLLATAARPVILAGLQAREAAPALRRLARRLRCPVLTTYKAKGTMPDDHAQTIGHFTGGSAEAACIGAADLVLLYGFDPVELIPQPWRYEVPILELGRAAGLRHYAPPAASLIGPLELAAAHLDDTGHCPGWPADEIAGLKAAMHDRMAAAAGGPGLSPGRVISALMAAAPPGCRLTVDAGAHMLAAMALWQADEPHDVLISNGLSTMGFALPAAIAAALATPDRPVIALTGDGGLMMCLSELATAVHHGCRIAVIVFNDAALSLIDIKQQARQMPSRGVRYPATDFAALAAAFGAPGVRVTDAADLMPAIEAALAAAGPALVDIAIDPSGYAAQFAALRG